MRRRGPSDGRPPYPCLAGIGTMMVPSCRNSAETRRMIAIGVSATISSPGKGGHVRAAILRSRCVSGCWAVCGACGGLDRTESLVGGRLWDIAAPRWRGCLWSVGAGTLWGGVTGRSTQFERLSSRVAVISASTAAPGSVADSAYAARPGAAASRARPAPPRRSVMPRRCIRSGPCPSARRRAPACPGHRPGPAQLREILTCTLGRNRRVRLLRQTQRCAQSGFQPTGATFSMPVTVNSRSAARRWHHERSHRP